MAKELVLKISGEDCAQRIDKYLGVKLGNLISRSGVKKLIEGEKVLVNNKKIKAHYKLKENDIISLVVEEPSRMFSPKPADIPLEIIYEDDYLLVINKPAGLVVHPAPGHYDDTLVNALLFHAKRISDFNGALRPGIVHRLDKDTSGVLVVAKNNQTHKHLAEQFKEHSVKKVYIAIVKGRIEQEEGVIEAPISRSLFNRKKMAVSFASTRQAQTYYRALSRNNDFSILEIYPKTGRTHQIRVHFAHIGHPILGDKIYGGETGGKYISRQALHAKKISFIHPQTNKIVEFEAVLHLDMRKIAEKSLNILKNIGVSDKIILIN